VGTIIGAVVLTTMTRLLSVLRIEPALRQVVYGLILIALLSLYGRQRRLRQ
jgi:ribose transport system permease protein